jgi:hypothetical protein
MFKDTFDTKKISVGDNFLILSLYISVLVLAGGDENCFQFLNMIYFVLGSMSSTKDEELKMT